MILWVYCIICMEYELQFTSMNNEGRITNMTGFSKLRRTFTLPLPRKKSGGSRFLTFDSSKSNLKNEQIAETRDSSSEECQLQDNRFSEHLEKETHVKASQNSIASEKTYFNSHTRKPSKTGSTSSKKRYFRWPTDALAKVIDVRKLLGRSKKNINRSEVYKTVSFNRTPGDILGICIKEVERIVTPENQSCSDVRQSGVVVSRILPGGVAERQQTLNLGDEIVLVNNTDVSHLSLNEVAALMDCHKQLVLTVRTDCNVLSNNGTSLHSISQQEESVVLMHQVCHNIVEDSLLLPRNQMNSFEFLTSSKPPVRDQPIPSIYDNDLPLVMEPVLDNLAQCQPQKESQAVESQYNEALRILMDAIRSFEESCDSNFQKSSKSTSDDFISNKESSPNGLVSEETPAESCTLSTIPHFPSLSDLPFPEEPVIPVFRTEVSLSDEIQVDGWSRCCSYRRSHSFSGYSNAETHSNFQVRTPILMREQKVSEHADSSITDSKQVSLDGVDVPDHFELQLQPDMKIDYDNHRHIEGSITVDQHKQWSGHDLSTEYVSPTILTHSKSDFSVAAEYGTNYIIQQTNSDLYNPVEKGSKIVFKIHSPNTTQENLTPQPAFSRNIWSKIASPSSLRKNKLSRTISKMTRKKYDSSNDWGSSHSAMELKTDSSSIVERYNLELGEIQNRRLSAYFIPRNGPSAPLAKSLDLTQFKKHKSSVSNPVKYSFASSQTSVEGSLLITVYGARDLKKVVSGAYCICQIDDDMEHRIRTSMSPCNGSVAWNECYEVKLKEANDLYLSVYAWESENQHKELAKAKLPISELLYEKLGVALKLAVKMEPRGTTYVKLSLEDPSKLQGPLVFGADLQSILDREKSDLPIPLLVRDCIHEVELRGLAIVGIYRLCGSAIAKRELRAKYESDSTSVKLCAEEYPDVNVITGILKDFLRELPQPLLPPELLEAVTQSMAEYTDVNEDCGFLSAYDTPHEINGIRQKSRSWHTSIILDLIEVKKKVSLPPAEKATLYALLNHLKRVAACHEKNKMTCQNLAVCFGPVLLGSVNSPSARGLDFSAAVGFKQHIQVLNFMVSNWPNDPVNLANFMQPSLSSQHEGIICKGLDRRHSNRISIVSLTRRISRPLPFAGENDGANTDLSDADFHLSFGGKMALRYSQRSGSLTDILESSNDGTGMESDFRDEGS